MPQMAKFLFDVHRACLTTKLYLCCLIVPFLAGWFFFTGKSRQIAYRYYLGIAVNVAVNADRAAGTRDGQAAVIQSLGVWIGIFDDARLQHLAVCRVKRKRGVRVVRFDPEDVTGADFPVNADYRIASQ